MNRIIDLILKTFGLLEAEGQAVKRCAVDLLVVAFLWMTATGLAEAEKAIPSGSVNDVFKRDKGGQLLVTKAGTPRYGTKQLIHVLSAILKQVNSHVSDQIEIPRTPRSGQLSLKAEDWQPVRQHHVFVEKWMRLNELAKLIQFTNSHRAGCVHPKYTVLVRTGRTSCTKPNIQQLPRAGGIRECFIPAPGHVFLALDFKFIELVTLAAVCEFQFGSSKLADAIRAGIDPHINTGALVRQMSVGEFEALETSDPAAFKADRQRAKAINFGVPGGLGADALQSYASGSFGVDFSKDESISLREKLVTEIYPELEPYLADDLMTQLAGKLGCSVATCWAALDQSGQSPKWLPAYVKNVVSGKSCRKDGGPYSEDFLEHTWNALQQCNANPDLNSALTTKSGSSELSQRLFSGSAIATLTGRIRAGVGFTAARNTPFQGLAADGAKLALFSMVDAGYRVVAFIHDEVLIELPVDADHDVKSKEVVMIMCDAMQEVTGNVPVSCGEPTLMACWSKDAKAVYDESGRLVVWSPNDSESRG